MDNKNQQAGPQLQIDITPELSKGVYSNFAIISHGPSEFILDFATMLPGNSPKANVVSRIISAPENTKRLLMALQENIARYEKEFGTIVLPEAKGRTISPFGTPKGEA